MLRRNRSRGRARLPGERTRFWARGRPACAWQVASAGWSGARARLRAAGHQRRVRREPAIGSGGGAGARRAGPAREPGYRRRRAHGPPPRVHELGARSPDRTVVPAPPRGPAAASSAPEPQRAPGDPGRGRQAGAGGTGPAKESGADRPEPGASWRPAPQARSARQSPRRHAHAWRATAGAGYREVRPDRVDIRLLLVVCGPPSRCRERGRERRGQRFRVNVLRRLPNVAVADRMEGAGAGKEPGLAIVAFRGFSLARI
jgi:hypothetical protein